MQSVYEEIRKVPQELAKRVTEAEAGLMQHAEDLHNRLAKELEIHVTRRKIVAAVLTFSMGFFAGALVMMVVPH